MIGSFISARRCRPRGRNDATSGTLKTITRLLRSSTQTRRRPASFAPPITRLADPKTVMMCIWNGTLAKTPCNELY